MGRGPGHVDLVSAGACEECGDLACTHPIAAETVPLEPVLATLCLAAATALERWNSQHIA